MILIKTAFDISKARLTDLEKQREISIANLQKYRAEGDLSENADYIQEKQKLENAEIEINQIKSLIHNADILDKENETNYTEIQLGCLFKMTIQRKGNFFNKSDSWEFKENNESYKYDKASDTTSVTGVYCFGGPTDICTEQGILSTESPLGKLLFGRVFASKRDEFEHDGQKIILEKVEG